MRECVVLFAAEAKSVVVPTVVGAVVVVMQIGVDVFAVSVASVRT